ncbi:MAG: ATP-dependent Clp protease ATP-binding subunit, partial [Spirochaetaceae bacterium]|nr:ATP-dependent Clp protease ATP-binding subunit [Spirochaetaceae bacterium]
MFRGLTMRAQRILAVDAQTETRRYYSAQLEPEHILLAILRDADSVAFKALEFLQVDIAQARKTLESIVLFEDKNPVKYGVFTSNAAPPSKRTKLLLQQAAEESRRLGSGGIGTEHILLAALYEADSCIHTLLADQNADANVLRLVLQTNFSRKSGGAEANGHSSCFQPLVMGGAPVCLERALKSQNSSTATPALDQFTRNLTDLALDGELDPVIGRDKEIMRM